VQEYEKGEKNNLKTLDSNAGITFGTKINSEKFFDNRIACEWLSTKEAAYFLAVSENALRIMVYRGQIKVYKFGRRLRFRRADCLALFKMKGA
jgi:excisionase family DNA binding protein